jgi:hypothetical protein
MADNKQAVGKPDRDRVDSKDDSEVGRVATKHGTTPAIVRQVIEKVGSMRKAIEDELGKRKGK